jgi:hypothetical protein
MPILRFFAANGDDLGQSVAVTRVPFVENARRFHVSGHA